MSAEPVQLILNGVHQLECSEHMAPRDIPPIIRAARAYAGFPATHNRARYEIVGQNITLEQVARIISQHAGKPPIPCQKIPRDQVLGRQLVPVRVSQSDYAREALDRMLYYYDTRCVRSTVHLYMVFLQDVEVYLVTATPCDGCLDGSLPAGRHW